MIPAGTVRNLTLTANANVYDITIDAGATFTISGSNQLSVFRNFTNNGSFVANNSTVSFTGCSNDGILSASGTQTFFNTTVSTDFQLTIASGTHQVSNNFAFTRGIVNQNASLVLLSSAGVSGAKNTSHVVGTVNKIGGSAFTFPVGDGTYYRPISIGASGNAAMQFRAQYFRAAQTFGATINSPLVSLSDCEYWLLNRVSGANNVSVSLSWNEAACFTGYITNPATLVVSRWNGSAWDSNGNGGISGSATNGTVVSAGNVTSWSSPNAFTIGSTDTENPLPVQFISFSALPVDNVVELVWNVASELNNDYFLIERSSDGTNFQPILTVTGAGTSNVAKRYTAIDSEPVPGGSYYRLTQVDYDGTRTDLHVVRVNREGFNQYAVLAYPNPVERDAALTLEYVTPRSEDITLSVITPLGVRLEQRNAAVKAGSNQIELRPAWRQAGIYFIMIQSSGSLQTLKVVVHE